METIAKIRRAYLSQGKAIKQIRRELHVSRKVVRSDATGFRYERSKPRLPRIDPWRGQIDRRLEENARRPPRERLTLIRIFEELRDAGPEGSYAAIQRYALSWRGMTTETVRWWRSSPPC